MATPGCLTLPNAVSPSAPSTGKVLLYCQEPDFYFLTAGGVQNNLRERFLPNALRNADLRFAQRQTPGTLATYSNLTGRSITADGWGVTNENASVQYIRTATSSAPESNLKAATYGTWSKITNTGKIVLSQVIENTDTMPLRNTICRFQVKLKASAAKTMKIAVIQNNSAATANTIAATFISAFGGNGVDPTLGTNLAYLPPQAGVTGDNCTADTNSFICSVTTSWQRFGGVVSVPSNCKNLIVVVWTDSQFAAADSFSMSEATFTSGYEIQDFNTLPYQIEMGRVQRFYCKSFDIDQTPVTALGLNTGEQRGIAGKAGAVANAGFIPIRFPVLMLNSPTVTVYNPAAANALARDIVTGADIGATAITGTTNRDFYTNSTGVAATAVGNLIAIHYSADGEI